MLSLTTGEPVAAVFGGPLSGRIVRLAQEDDEPDDDPGDTSGEDSQDTEDGGAARLLRAMMAGPKASRAALARLGRREQHRAELEMRRELLLDREGVMFVIPSEKPERVYISGQSGSGKSCLAANYMNEYVRRFPERKIWLFSSHEDEEAYREIEHQRVPLEAFDPAAAPPEPEAAPEAKKGAKGAAPAKKGPKPKVEAPMPVALEQLASSLVVFDDADNCSKKTVQERVNRLRDEIITKGRHQDTHCVWINHLMTDWSRTRKLLMEASRVFFFPGFDKQQVRYYVTKHASLEPAAVKKILGLRSRWVMLSRTAPNYVVHEHGAFML